MMKKLLKCFLISACIFLGKNYTQADDVYISDKLRDKDNKYSNSVKLDLVFQSANYNLLRYKKGLEEKSEAFTIRGYVTYLQKMVALNLEKLNIKGAYYQARTLMHVLNFGGNYNKNKWISTKKKASDNDIENIYNKSVSLFVDSFCAFKAFEMKTSRIPRNILDEGKEITSEGKLRKIFTERCWGEMVEYISDHLKNLHGIDTFSQYKKESIYTEEESNVLKKHYENMRDLIFSHLNRRVSSVFSNKCEGVFNNSSYYRPYKYENETLKKLFIMGENDSNKEEKLKNYYKNIPIPSKENNPTLEFTKDDKKYYFDNYGYIYKFQYAHGHGGHCYAWSLSGNDRCIAPSKKKFNLENKKYVLSKETKESNNYIISFYKMAEDLYKKNTENIMGFVDYTIDDSFIESVDKYVKNKIIKIRVNGSEEQETNEEISNRQKTLFEAITQKEYSEHLSSSDQEIYDAIYDKKKRFKKEHFYNKNYRLLQVSFEIFWIHDASTWQYPPSEEGKDFLPALMTKLYRKNVILREKTATNTYLDGGSLRSLTGSADDVILSPDTSSMAFYDKIDLIQGLTSETPPEFMDNLRWIEKEITGRHYSTLLPVNYWDF
jgi:hypothetical protein